jgi:hypothetical protein
MYFNDLNKFYDQNSLRDKYNVEVLAMDCITCIAFLGVCAHVALRTKKDGIVLIITALCVGTLVELVSVYIMSSRCHAESFIMIGECCSVTSILYYVPWMYSCYAIGNRVPLQSKFARNLLVASLHPLFSLMYEIVGANCGWIYWGQPPQSSLQSSFSMLFGGITGNDGTAFIRMQEHSLNERVFGVPVISIMFQFFFGVAFHWSRSLAKMMISPTSKRHTSVGESGGDGSGSSSSSSSVKPIKLKPLVIVVDCITEVFIVSILAPLVALVPLALLVKFASSKNSVIIDSSTLASGKFQFMAPLFDGKYTDVWFKAISSSILIASITAVFADPIFRRVNKHNIDSFSSNLELVAEAARTNRQGVPTIKKIAQAYTALLGKDDRDLILLGIPYIYFSSLVLVVLRHIYIDIIENKTWLKIFSPDRIAVGFAANASFSMFTYFNFSELEWNTVKKVHNGSSKNFFASRSTIFNTISPNRVIQTNKGSGKETRKDKDRADDMLPTPRPLTEDLKIRFGVKESMDEIVEGKNLSSSNLSGEEEETSEYDIMETQSATEAVDYSSNNVGKGSGNDEIEVDTKIETNEAVPKELEVEEKLEEEGIRVDDNNEELNITEKSIVSSTLDYERDKDEDVGEVEGEKKG